MNSFIKILNSEIRFPVNNVYCIGKNYSEHIKELGGKEIPEKPVIFLKPNSSLNTDNSNFNFPEYQGNLISSDVHYETEIIILISKNGENIPVEKAYDYIYGFGIGFDLTLRDVQSVAKSKGLPWATAKGFKGSAPVSEIIKKEDFPVSKGLHIEMFKNGELMQKADSSEMIFSIEKIISYISYVFGLSEGDLIFTGTPSGVGQIKSNDTLSANLSGLVTLNLKIN